jgi:hypothetical protein
MEHEENQNHGTPHQNDCDLEMTLDLIDLFNTPREDRDNDWLEDFLEVVPTASLVALEPQIQRGPDGFPYLTLALPKPNEDFDAVSVKHSISFCLKNGCGIAIFANPEEKPQPEWIFTFGSLWSFEQFQDFKGDRNEELVKEGAEGAREVQVSPPSDDFLPHHARKAIAKFLKTALGLQNANVAMITDPSNQNIRSLMFTDLQPERFENEEQFMQLMTALRWYLPATRRLMVAAPQLAQYSNPL